MRSSGFLPLAAVLLLPSLVLASTPDVGPSFATVEGPCGVYATPAGTGPTLASAGCTVTVHVLDAFDQPIASYPFQDIWLDDAGSEDLGLCPGGAVADANTDADGVTTISGAIAGGGRAAEGLQVYLSGLPLQQDALPIVVNSPDLNADLRVDVYDLGVFASGYFAAYAFEIDLSHDGVLGIADLGIFASHFGDVCP